MGSLTRTSNFQNCIKKNNKIPEYARDFKKEWLVIRGINKMCGEFIERLDFGGDLFISPQANRIKYFIKNFLKYEECGKIKDISGFYFKYYDARNIDCLEDQLCNYCDLYVDPDSFDFDKEYYDLYIDRDYPGFKEFFKLISLLNGKLKTEKLTSSLRFDSDSDSGSDSDSDIESDSD